MKKTVPRMGASVIVPVTGVYQIGNQKVTLVAGEHSLVAGEGMAEKEEVPVPSDDAIRQTAKHLYEEEGLVEIDDGAEISHGGDPGAYVQAWVWVPYEDVTSDRAFNPLLEKWLHDRDQVTMEWPHDISDSVVAEADKEFADPPATVLDDLGWPMDNPNLPDFAAAVMRDGPARIVTQSGGTAAPPDPLFYLPSVVFIRDDGWSLAAPLGLEQTAHDIWANRWIGGLLAGKAGVFNIKQLRDHLGLEVG